MAELNAKQKKSVEELTSLGLPEVQAIASVTAVHKPTAPTHMYYTLKIKDGIDAAEMAELEKNWKAYAAASKASKGKITISHAISDGWLIAVEVHDSPSSMDIHIGNCFPDYIKCVGTGSAVMKEIIGTCTSSKEIEWWKKSASAWGAEKFIITAAL